MRRRLPVNMRANQPPSLCGLGPDPDLAGGAAAPPLTRSTLSLISSTIASPWLSDLLSSIL
jgi:hypothetical protein